MIFKPKMFALACLIATVTARLQEEAIVYQERDPTIIQHILETLINEGVTLKDYRTEQQRRTKTSILVIERFHFEAKDGEEFVIYSETITDVNSLSVELNVGEDHDKSIKLLLSLVGGGNIKSITIKKIRRKG